MTFFISWGRAYARHLEAEIAWYREELRYQRDESARLNNALVSLKQGMTISTVAPSVPRVIEPTTKTTADEKYDAEFHGIGAFDEEPAGRGAL